MKKFSKLFCQVKKMYYFCKRNGEGNGQKFPLFCSTFNMIDKKVVESIVNECLIGSDLFLVGVKVSKNNVITVTIDGDNGVVVDDCIDISRKINSELDRDKEDYELTVTSFGLGEYFTLPRQYKKNLSQQVEVVLNEGEKVIGVLSEVNDEYIVVKYKEKKQEHSITIAFNDIKKTKVVISFGNNK